MSTETTQRREPEWQRSKSHSCAYRSKLTHAENLLLACNRCATKRSASVRQRGEHRGLGMSSNAQKTTTTVDPALLEQCGCKRERLSNACHYSFQDLYRAKAAALGQSGDDAAEACAALYKRDRDAINETVREWADVAGWETEMHRGSDGQEYRAFAPEAPS